MSGESLRLWAVGVDTADPENWSPWDEVALVIAHDAKEAQTLAEKPGRCILVEFDEPKLLVAMPEPNWGDDI